MGNFEATKKYLVDSQKALRTPFPEARDPQHMESNHRGAFPKLNPGWQTQFIISSTRLYFNPTVQYLGEALYLVSNHYMVSLQSYPVLDKLIQYLLRPERLQCSPEDLQINVWKQSTQQLGWQQKIRNSIMSIRTLFPYTIAPLIVHMEK